jgi:hypothetical protein
VPKLLIQEGGQQSVFELFDDEVTVGRGAANVIQVADQRASKHHAVVRRVHGRPKLVDLESRNGTRVNGEFRNQRWLEHGDVVSIGEMTMTFDASDAPAAAAATAAHAHPAPVAAVAAPRAPAPVVTVHRRPGGPHHARPHGRARDDQDGEEHGGRVVPRRRDNSLAVAVLVGAGLILGVFLLFKMMGSGGTGNASALAHAKRLADDDVPAAVAYLQQHGDPRDVDGYRSVEAQLTEWKELLQDQDRQVKEQEGADTLKQIHRNLVEQHKNGMTDAQLGQALLDWAEKYDGTIKWMELQNSANPPFPEFRELMAKARTK